MSTARTIGHYEVLELLGEGGIGQVHRARDTVLGREVAIKSLRPELLNDASFVERFRTEATNLARLNHPNITTVYALLESGKQLYMVMELVRGRTLEAILQERHSLPPDEAVAIVSQAADGLAYAHDVGIIHRDIKPANLILTDSGVIKITDFGIARVQGSQRLTRDGSIIGTLAYMAPEQLRAEEVDARTDLYSLAIVFYEMLSGSVPFTATSDYDLMRAQIHTPPERLKHRVGRLDSQLEKALMRALAKKPTDRFSSVAAFKEALGVAAPRPRTEQLIEPETRGERAPDATVVLAPRPRTSIFPLFRGFAIGTSAIVVAGIMGFAVHEIMTPTNLTTVEVPPASPRQSASRPAVIPKSADAAIGSIEPARESAVAKETLASTSPSTNGSFSPTSAAQSTPIAPIPPTPSVQSAAVMPSPPPSAPVTPSPPPSQPPVSETVSIDRSIGSDEVPRGTVTVAATPPTSSGPTENTAARPPVASVRDEEEDSAPSKHRKRIVTHSSPGGSEQQAPRVRETQQPRQAQQDHGSSGGPIGVGF
jgi:serine/threonine protein kinase